LLRIRLGIRVDRIETILGNLEVLEE